MRATKPGKHVTKDKDKDRDNKDKDKDPATPQNKPVGPVMHTAEAEDEEAAAPTQHDDVDAVAPTQHDDVDAVAEVGAEAAMQNDVVAGEEAEAEAVAGGEAEAVAGEEAEARDADEEAGADPDADQRIVNKQAHEWYKQFMNMADELRKYGNKAHCFDDTNQVTCIACSM